jgi:hypothetical protein
VGTQKDSTFQKVSVHRYVGVVRIVPGNVYAVPLAGKFDVVPGVTGICFGIEVACYHKAGNALLFVEHLHSPCVALADSIVGVKDDACRRGNVVGGGEIVGSGLCDPGVDRPEFLVGGVPLKFEGVHYFVKLSLLFLCVFNAVHTCACLVVVGNGRIESYGGDTYLVFFT